MDHPKNPIIVVGGGAAGILAAVRAGELGANVVLLEKNQKLGIKILISGGGKCNITHAGDMQSIGASFVTSEERFLRRSFYRYTNLDILHLLSVEGVGTFARPNGRVFPRSGRAGDVLGALTRVLHRDRVDVRCDTPADDLFCEDGIITGVAARGKKIQSHHVVLATGGISYSKTGTTGDGYAWAKKLGHSIVPLRPALAPIKVMPPFPADWRGVALRDGELSVYSDGKKIFSWADDVLITHEGISGPATLEVSRAAALCHETQRVNLRFDFLPSMGDQEVDNEIIGMTRQHPDRQVATYAERWLPNRIAPTVLRSAGIDSSTKGYNLRKEDRRALVGLLKSWHIGRVDAINIDRGEVTAGGVDLSEIDSKTMRSRKTTGLYICGEILDIAGPVGGYNLQAAFSTGYVAGETAALDWLGQSRDA